MDGSCHFHNNNTLTQEPDHFVNQLINFYLNNPLVCTIEWITPVHDGPVKILVKSPFMPNLLLSVGGYSFAIWNEGVMVRVNILSVK